MCISAAVTRLALETDMGAFERKSGERVIVAMRIDRSPGGCAVTTGAGMPEAVSHVIRIGRAGIRHLVTGIAIVGSIGIACAMAGLAFEIDMSTGDCKAGLVMIEFRRLPCSCRVALDAVVAEVGRLVVRVAGCGKITAVTRIAIGRCADITAAVATLAVQRAMRAGERKAGGIMVEGCRLPGIEVVTGATIMVEVSCRMVGLFGLRKGCVMTAKAISRSPCIGITVAILALNCRMGTREGE